MKFRGAKTSRAGILAVWWLILLALDAGALFGLSKLGYNDGVELAFESSTSRYSEYLEFKDQFEGGSNDLIVMFEAADFAQPDALETVLDFVLEVQFLDGISGIISPFSVQRQVSPDKSEPLVPPTLPEQAEMAARFDDARRSSPELGRLLSEDRQMMIVVLSLTQNAHKLEIRHALQEDVRELMVEMVEGSNLTATLTGFPVLRDSVVSALFDDFLLMNLLGAVMGTIVAALALRSLRLALLTMMSAGTAMLWVMGLFGWVGININLVTVALPVLILVLSFASALHLTLELRRQLLDKDIAPVTTTVIRIGPACVLTALTTAIAFGGLMLSPSSLIFELGYAGVLAVLISLVAVFAAHPLIFATIHHFKKLESIFSGQRGHAPKIVNMGFFPWAAVRFPVPVSVGSVALLLVAVGYYTTVEPVYSLYDNMPRDGASFQALERIESELAPISAVNFPVWIDAVDAVSLAELKIAHDVISRHADGNQVVSLVPLVARAADAGMSLETLLDKLPDTLRSRLISKDGEWALVSVLVTNDGARSARKYITELTDKLMADPQLEQVALARPTGLLTMSSFLSRDMLLDLNRCFLAAVIVSALLIMLWLRNPIIGLVALVPNVLPVALVGAWLVISGQGLEFSSGIALTIAFGLAIDDTVHVLNRIRLNTADGSPMDTALIVNSVRQAAPALVMTSAVLSLGLLGTLFGSLPSVAYFGKLSIFAFLLALIADLLVLPACLIVAARIFPQRALEIRQ